MIKSTQFTNEISILISPKIKTYSRYDNEIAALLYFTISNKKIIGIVLPPEEASAVFSDHHTLFSDFVFVFLSIKKVI